MTDFWSKLDKTGDCWIWTGSCDTGGYGNLKFNGKNVRAHRLAYSLANDWELPKTGDHSAVIMHTCDNRTCCNPSHLVLGTQTENIADMKGKGRASRKNGTDNGRAVLTEGHVRAIRRSKFGKVWLSRMYGVSPAQIQRIRAGKQWAA